jgi:DNA-binding NarL/FixJ family response regulator
MVRTISEQRSAVTTTERVLLELLSLERELAEMEYVRRSDALERVSDAVRRLGELATPEGILPRAAAELGASSEFERVVISEVVDGRMTPLAVWAGNDTRTAEEALTRLAANPVKLEYPLLELEAVHQQAPEVVVVSQAGARTPALLVRELGWESYVVAALTAAGETIGLLHADATTAGRTVDAIDAEVAGRYAAELSGVFERAVLRHTLDLHRAELASATHWMGTRLSRLEDAGSLTRPRAGDRRAMTDPLTPRELEVIRLMGRGYTNLAIARALVVREGTVKYHVKNILRKLGATSRADAVAKFVRAGEEAER